MTKRTREIVYRNWTQRITTVLWGLAVCAFGAGVIAHLNGYRVDGELGGIIVLTALGFWILVSAVVALIPRREPRTDD